jgi:hypothetical protein
MGLGNYANPLAVFETKYEGNFQNLSTSLLLDYSIVKYFSLKTNLGYNFTISDETRIIPTTALDPYDVQMPSSIFGNSNNKTWIIEPQAVFRKATRIGKVDLVVGSTFQMSGSKSVYINASNYSNDLLLNLHQWSRRYYCQ